MLNEKNALTHEVIGATIEVPREMGPGLLESVYQQCMEHELRLRGLEFQPPARLPLIYKSTLLEREFIMDIYFPGKLVVELEAVEALITIHTAQLLRYLRLSRTHVGLLLNFNVPVLKDGMKRHVP